MGGKIMVSDKETLDEIKKDIKRILELLENPKREIRNEKPYNNYNSKKDFIIKDPNSPATQGQKDFLIDKEYNGDVEKLTKLEASNIIGAYINKQK
jgi:hypothetical protein